MSVFKMWYSISMGVAELAHEAIFTLTICQRSNCNTSTCNFSPQSVEFCTNWGLLYHTAYSCLQTIWRNNSTCEYASISQNNLLPIAHLTKFNLKNTPLTPFDVESYILKAEWNVWNCLIWHNIIKKTV